MYLKLPTQVRTRGFTMVELMVGIAMLLIALALGVPYYGVWLQNSKLRNAAESISSGLKLARSEAVRRNAPVQFSLGAGSSWIVGCATVSATCPATIQSHATGDGSSNTIVVDAGDVDTITFNNLGRRTVPLAAAGVTTINIDSSAISASESRDLRITINVSGSVLLCDPNVDASDSRACTGN